jgi:proline iminopeptidase
MTYGAICPAVCLSLLLAGRASGQDSLKPGEGYVQVPGGRVWYRIVGSGTRTPLLVLHGGRGAGSYYLKPLAALADQRPVVFYDRLGVGHSDPPPDTSVWRLEHAVDELQRVRTALGLHDIYLYGHSWGTILAVEYLLTKPTGVHGVILSGPALSASRARRDLAELRATLPDSLQRVLTQHERDGTCDAPEYRAAVVEFQKTWFARRRPLSVESESSFAASARSESLFRKMGGRPCATFSALATYDRTDRLAEIRVPTLFTAGRYELPTMETIHLYQSRIPGSQLAILEHSGHVTIQDEPEENLRVIRQFLDGLERTR